VLLVMPTSQGSAVLPASTADSTSTRATVGKQATPPGVKVGIEDRVTTKQSPAPKRGKRRTRKGQRLDLRSLLHGTADEAQEGDNSGQGEEIESEMAGLEIGSSEMPAVKWYSGPSEGLSIPHCDS
jgi:hypothetical protein